MKVKRTRWKYQRALRCTFRGCKGPGPEDFLTHFSDIDGILMSMITMKWRDETVITYILPHIPLCKDLDIQA